MSWLSLLVEDDLLRFWMTCNCCNLHATGACSAWDSITPTLNSEYACTMDANPQIKTPRNIQSNVQSGRKRAAKSPSKSSSRKKVKSSDEEGDPKMNLLNRLVRNQERTS